MSQHPAPLNQQCDAHVELASELRACCGCDQMLEGQGQCLMCEAAEAIEAAAQVLTTQGAEIERLRGREYIIARDPLNTIFSWSGPREHKPQGYIEEAAPADETKGSP